MSYSAYKKSVQLTESPRETEYRAFVLATGRLLEAARENDGIKLCHAAQFNRELWSVLQTDLSEPANPLPDALKANLISLSLWVDRHTSLVMQGRASVDSLVEVNKQIMEGLRGLAAPAVQAAG